jgi:tetratricopeptide (TPR) repeat protein
LCGLVAYTVASFFDFPYERITHQAFLGIMFASSARLYSSFKQVSNAPLSKNWLSLTFAVALGLTTIYSLSALKFEKQNAKIRVGMERKDYDRVLRIAEDTPQFFRNLDPEFVPISSYTGFIYFTKNNFVKAKEEYEKSLKVHPTNIFALRSLAVMHLRMGNTEKGKELLDKALYIVPTFASALENLSVYYEKQGDLEKSYVTLQKIRKRDRSDKIKKRMEYLKAKIESRKK